MNIEKLDFSDAYARIQKVTGCTEQAELAHRLGIRQCVISDSRRRNVVSHELSKAFRWYLGAKQQAAAYVSLSKSL